LKFPSHPEVQVISRFEPSDKRNPRPRPPLVNARWLLYESQFTNAGWYCSAESLDRHPEMWARGLPRSVRDSHHLILAYLDWNVREFTARKPLMGQPTEVVLMYRYVPTPLPGQPASGRSRDRDAIRPGGSVTALPSRATCRSKGTTR